MQVHLTMYCGAVEATPPTCTEFLHHTHRWFAEPWSSEVTTQYFSFIRSPSRNPKTLYNNKRGTICETITLRIEKKGVFTTVFHWRHRKMTVNWWDYYDWQPRNIKNTKAASPERLKDSIHVLNPLSSQSWDVFCVTGCDVTKQLRPTFVWHQIVNSLIGLVIEKWRVEMIRRQHLLYE